MAGQVVQAIIVPENGNLELLKEIFGNDFEKIRTDMAEQDGTSVVYVQAQKSAFKSLSTEVPVGDSGVKIRVGELKAAAAQMEEPNELPMSPLQEIAGVAVSEYPVTYGCILDDEFWRFQGLVYGAFGQVGSTPDQRRQIVMTALDSLKAFLEKLITDTAGSALEMPKSAKRGEDGQGQTYGLGDFATRIIGELRKSEKHTLEEVKRIAANVTAERPDENTKQTADEKSATKGEGDMSEEKFVTEEALATALAPIAEKTEALTAGLESINALTEAMKSIQEKLTGGDGKTVEGTTDQSADPTKAASVEVDLNKTIGDLTDKINTMATDLIAAKSALDEQALKTEALQHAGGQTHVEVEDPARKAVEAEQKKCGMNTVFAQRGYGSR